MIASTIHHFKLRTVPSISLPKGSKKIWSEPNQLKSDPLVCLLSFSSEQNIYLIPKDFDMSGFNDEFATLHLPSTVALSDSDRVRPLKHLQEVVATETGN